RWLGAFFLADDDGLVFHLDDVSALFLANDDSLVFHLDHVSALFLADDDGLGFHLDDVSALFFADYDGHVRLFIGLSRYGFHPYDLCRFFCLDNLVGLIVVARHPLDLLGSRDRLQAEAHTLPVTVDANDAQQVILPFAQHLARVADARPRN